MANLALLDRTLLLQSTTTTLLLYTFDGQCKIQLCPVLCMTKKSSREGVPETS
ncbi:hypothetical protein T03_12149 [Trichinella britovi]|uniref:Uncharacterized protein n=1 Tax=Trichinella britovi TaxID=45882 RepID=A0A0V0Z0M0_TRIBR|nr:hypothetical protein T03_4575 [Trichinella britovi]KRY24144.1 hypothetical protein T03_12149 [Trichinella britovi]